MGVSGLALGTVYFEVVEKAIPKDNGNPYSATVRTMEVQESFLVEQYYSDSAHDDLVSVISYAQQKGEEETAIIA
jgi:hypothetical protein